MNVTHADDVVIRSATVEDAVHIVPLLKQLGYPQDLEIVTKKLERYAQADGHGAWVAELQGKIVGCVAFGSYELFAETGRCCHIDVLVVDQTVQRKKIGQQLIHAVEKFAQKHHYYVIELIVGMWRKKDGIHDFYHAMGYHNGGEGAVQYLRKELHA